MFAIRFISNILTYDNFNNSYWDVGFIFSKKDRNFNTFNTVSVAPSRIRLTRDSAYNGGVI